MSFPKKAYIDYCIMMKNWTHVAWKLMNEGIEKKWMVFSGGENG